MNTRSACWSTIARTVLMLSTLLLAASYASVSNAAQGCGYGWHRGYYGGCVRNYPGPWAQPAYRHPGCWRNKWGQLRCW